MDPTEGLYVSDEEDTSAAKILHQLTVAWMNEKLSPDLLNYESELVDCMMDQIRQMEENLGSLNRNDFRLVPHQMEVDRIRYVLSSYLRTRLEKIETFTEYLLRRNMNLPNDDVRLMSQGEVTFAEKFCLILHNHFYEEGLKYMPTLLRDDEAQSEMEVRPNLNSTVFVSIVNTVRGFLISDEVVELPAGSTHLMPFVDVKRLILDGSAYLK